MENIKKAQENIDRLEEKIENILYKYDDIISGFDIYHATKKLMELFSEELKSQAANE